MSSILPIQPTNRSTSPHSPFEIVLTEMENELSKNDWDYQRLQVKTGSLILTKVSSSSLLYLDRLKKVSMLIQEKLPYLENDLKNYVLYIQIWGALQKLLFQIAGEKGLPSVNEENTFLFLAYIYNLFQFPSDMNKYLLDSSIAAYFNVDMKIDWSSLFKKMEFFFQINHQLEAKATFQLKLIKNLLRLTNSDPLKQSNLYQHIQDIAIQAEVNPECKETFTLDDIHITEFIHYLCSNFNPLLNLSSRILPQSIEQIYLTLGYLKYYLERSSLIGEPEFENALQNTNKLLYGTVRLLYRDPPMILSSSGEIILDGCHICMYALFSCQHLQSFSGPVTALKKNEQKRLDILNKIPSDQTAKSFFNIIKSLYEKAEEENSPLDFGLSCHVMIEGLQDNAHKQMFFNSAFTFVYSRHDALKIISLLTANPELFKTFEIETLLETKSILTKDKTELFFPYHEFLMYDSELHLHYLKFVMGEFSKWTKETFLDFQVIKDVDTVIKLILSQFNFEKQYIRPHFQTLFNYITSIIHIEHPECYNTLIDVLNELFCKSVDQQLDQLMAYAISTLLDLVKLHKKPCKLSDEFSSKISNLSKDNPVHVIVCHLLNKNLKFFSNVSDQAKTKIKDIAGQKYTENNYLDDLKKPDDPSDIDSRSSALFSLLSPAAEVVFSKSRSEIIEVILQSENALQVCDWMGNCAADVSMDFAETAFKINRKKFDYDEVRDIIGIIFSSTLNILVSNCNDCLEARLLKRFLNLKIDYSNFGIIDSKEFVSLLELLIFYPNELDKRERGNLLALAERIVPEILSDNALKASFFKNIYQIKPAPLIASNIRINKRYEVKNYTRYLDVMELFITNKSRKTALKDPKVLPQTDLEFHYLYALQLQRLEKSNGADHKVFQKLATLDLKTLLGDNLALLVQSHMTKNQLIEKPSPQKVEKVAEKPVKVTSSVPPLSTQVVAATKSTLPASSSASNKKQISPSKEKSKAAQDSSKKTTAVAKEVIAVPSPSIPEEKPKEEVLSKEQLLEGLRNAQDREKIKRDFFALKNKNDLNDLFILDVVQILLEKKKLSFAVLISEKIQDPNTKSKTAHSIIETAIQTKTFKYKRPALKALNFIVEDERDKEKQRIEDAFQEQASSSASSTSSEKRAAFTRDRSENVADFSKQPSIIDEFVHTPRELKRRLSFSEKSAHQDHESLKQAIKENTGIRIRPGKGGHMRLNKEGSPIPAVSIPTNPKIGTQRSIIQHIKLFTAAEKASSSSSEEEPNQAPSPKGKKKKDITHQASSSGAK